MKNYFKSARLFENISFGSEEIINSVNSGIII